MLTLMYTKSNGELPDKMRKHHPAYGLVKSKWIFYEKDMYLFVFGICFNLSFCRRDYVCNLTERASC